MKADKFTRVLDAKKQTENSMYSELEAERSKGCFFLEQFLLLQARLNAVEHTTHSLRIDEVVNSQLLRELTNSESARVVLARSLTELAASSSQPSTALLESGRVRLMRSDRSLTYFFAFLTANFHKVIRI